MNVTAIALLMIGKTGCGALGGLMASAALWSLGLAGHLFRVHMLFVRERLDSELTHLRRKAYPCPLSVNRRRMTYDAHLARCVSEVLCVTFNASRVAGKHWCDAVIRALMAEGAVLCLGLVLNAGVIEG